MADAPMTIVRLTAENLKRLRAVTIEPDGNLVVLGGRNGQGKTSVLDAIEYALGGRPRVAEPVRRGADHAEVVCDLGELIVRRRFTAGGGTSLEVTTRDGLRYTSPQAVLDKLVGTLTFDPLAFARMGPWDQRVTLQQLVGLDFAELDKRRAAAFTERTMVNREEKAAAARLAAAPFHADAPAGPVSVADLSNAMTAALKQNAANDAVRRSAVDAEARYAKRARRIAELERELAAARAELDVAAAERAAASHAAACVVDDDLEPLQCAIASADETNAKVRANRQRAELEAEHAGKVEASEELTREIAAIDEQKAAAIAAAKMPIAGLGFADGGVTLNDLPMEQASAAEQLRVSVAIGLAANPKLRVLLIRDASLLDTDSLRLVGEMAAAAGAQVWLERVENDAATTVVIDDGMVQEASNE